MPFDRGANSADRTQRLPTFGKADYLFVLRPGYCMLSLSGALDILHILNGCLGYSAVSWSLRSVDGAPVRSASGLELSVEGALPSPTEGARVVVVVGGDDAVGDPLPDLPRIAKWLRRSVQHGSQIAALGSASLDLARAGLLANRRAAVHRSNIEAMSKIFPEIDLRPEACAVHDDVMTSSGGVSSIDLFLRLAENHHGPTVVRKVAEHLNYQSIRTHNETRANILSGRLFIRNGLVLRAIELMGRHSEQPLEIAEIAAGVGVSRRQLERLFQQHVQMAPVRYYSVQRLERANRLLCFTDSAVTEVAAACGFRTTTHFSRLFRETFGISPHKLHRGV